MTVAADRAAVPSGPGVVAGCVPGWSERPARTTPHAVGVLLGEGIGPEVVDAALVVLDAVGDTFGLEFDVQTSEALAPPGPHGRMLDPRTADFFDRLFAAGTPAFCGAVSGRFVYELRAHFELYCKLVPVRAHLSDRAKALSEIRAVRTMCLPLAGHAKDVLDGGHVRKRILDNL